MKNIFLTLFASTYKQNLILKKYYHHILFCNFHTIVNLETRVPGNSLTEDNPLPDGSVIICPLSHPWRALLLNFPLVFFCSPIFCHHSGSGSHNPMPGTFKRDSCGFPVQTSLFKPTFLPSPF